MTGCVNRQINLWMREMLVAGVPPDTASRSIRWAVVLGWVLLGKIWQDLEVHWVKWVMRKENAKTFFLSLSAFLCFTTAQGIWMSFSLAAVKTGARSMKDVSPKATCWLTKRLHAYDTLCCYFSARDRNHTGCQSVYSRRVLWNNNPIATKIRCERYKAPKNVSGGSLMSALFVDSFAWAALSMTSENGAEASSLLHLDF